MVMGYNEIFEAALVQYQKKSIVIFQPDFCETKKKQPFLQGKKLM